MILELLDNTQKKTGRKFDINFQEESMMRFDMQDLAFGRFMLYVAHLFLSAH